MNCMRMGVAIGLGLTMVAQQRRKVMLVTVILQVGVLQRISIGVIQTQQLPQKMSHILGECGMSIQVHSIFTFMRSFPVLMPQPIPDTLLHTTMVAIRNRSPLTKRYSPMYGLLCLAHISTMG